jgi:hypothetical protein
MMIAAIVVLTSVLGVYAIQREQVKDIKLRNIADEISGIINDINSLSGETKINVTSEEGRGGIYIEPFIDGKGYEILITQYRVVTTQGNRRYSSNFIEPVHLWVPVWNTYNWTQIDEIDSSNNTLELNSGDEFIIERKLIDLKGERVYMTFVHV